MEPGASAADAAELAELIGRAREARAKAYAPYSNFPVGAALQADDGQVFTGCNVESASYGLTCCAERVAVFTAVAAGRRSFTRLAVVSRGAAAPCGACRQVLAEFGTDLELLLADEVGAARTVGLADLLPQSFGPQDLLG